MSVVAFPFTVSKVSMTSKVYGEGSIEAVTSELSMFLSTEEGEVHHLPDYGVKRRDMLFKTDFDEPTLGVLLFRFQEKVSKWFNSVKLEDITVMSQGNNSVILKVRFTYNGISGQTQAVIQ